MAVYGKFLALTFLISFSLAFFLGWLADVFHPLRMAMATLTCYGAVAAWGAVFATTAHSFLIAWILHGVLSGCYMTSAASLGQRLFPHSRYAQFASAAGITGSMAHVVLGPAMGGVIDRSGNIYRYTFVAGCGLAVIALVAAWFVYVRFIKLGGPTGYVAPGEAEEAKI
jgi:MFS family permease